MCRGSREHVLDWVERPTFLPEFAELLMGFPVEFSGESIVMPRGHVAPHEARLDTFGRAWKPGHRAWEELADWWLRHRKGANTPNWDLLVTCRLEGRAGLVLVEAKANGPELSWAGKPLRKDASRRSKENHEHIAEALRLATEGWRSVDSRVTLRRDSHYQLANRLAFAWKLATLEIPVVLVYLGFTGDAGMREFFRDQGAWDAAFEDYRLGVFPSHLLDRRVTFGDTPVWVLSRARGVLEPSSPRASRHG